MIKNHPGADPYVVIQRLPLLLIKPDQILSLLSGYVDLRDLRTQGLARTKLYKGLQVSPFFLLVCSKVQRVVSSYGPN